MQSSFVSSVLEEEVERNYSVGMKHLGRYVESPEQNVLNGDAAVVYLERSALQGEDGQRWYALAMAHMCIAENNVTNNPARVYEHTLRAEQALRLAIAGDYGRNAVREEAERLRAQLE